MSSRVLPVLFVAGGLVHCSLLFPTRGITRAGDGGAPDADVAPERDAAASDGAPCADTALTLCGGTCVDLNVDPSHCGSCEAACVLPRCVEGLCDAFIAGSVLGDPDAVHVDGLHVYWMLSLAGAARIQRVSIDEIADGGVVETVAAGLNGAAQLRGNRTALFVRSGRSVQMIAKAADAGPPQLVAQVPVGESIPSFAVDERYVYALRRLDTKTTVERTPAAPQPPDAGTTLALATLMHASPPGLATMGGDDLYFFREVSTGNALLFRLVDAAVWVEGADLPRLLAVTGPGQARPGGVAVDPAHVYWTAQGVFRAKRTGAEVEQLAPRTTDEPSTPAVDDRFVYWGSRSLGVLRRVPKDGGAVVVLGRTPASDVSVALDERYLYWTSDGRLRALPKPR